MEPFRINISQSDLDDLNTRIDATRWPAAYPGAAWSRGVPLSYLRRITEYWRHEYSWRAAEAKLNEFPQFTTEIDGHNIHFLHVTSPHPDAIPLLLTHGWPGSIVEFTGIIGPLTDPKAHGADGPAFHLVIPSLPGYGFSGPSPDEGWTTRRIAKAWAELMSRLGYDRYVAQGGDRGVGVTRDLGIVDPEHVAAVHVNGGFTFPGGADPDDETLSERERIRVRRMQEFMSESGAYLALHSSRPYSVAYAFNDSPVGLLAWIIERFKDWSDPAKQLPEDAVDLDQLLTNVCVYWFTQTAGSAANAYYEDAVSGAGWGPKEPSTVPAGVAQFTTQDIALRRDDEAANNIVHWAEYFRGGHFAAMEAPDLLVADLREFFGRHH
ncbi:epoxide hydrolase family protein [Stackebrandtia nassauensis]|nr:epoxide hydrolase family protein [Stackebrandtia nassauensis]